MSQSGQSIFCTQTNVCTSMLACYNIACQAKVKVNTLDTCYITLLYTQTNTLIHTIEKTCTKGTRLTNFIVFHFP